MPDFEAFAFLPIERIMDCAVEVVRRSSIIRTLSPDNSASSVAKSSANAVDDV